MDRPKIGSAVVAGTPVDFYREQYGMSPFNLAVTADCDDGAPWATVSVNIVGMTMDPDEFVVNHNILHYAKDLLATGLFEDTGKRANYGFIRNCPVWRIKKV